VIILVGGVGPLTKFTLTYIGGGQYIISEIKGFLEIVLEMVNLLLWASTDGDNIMDDYESYYVPEHITVRSLSRMSETYYTCGQGCGNGSPFGNGWGYFSNQWIFRECGWNPDLDYDLLWCISPGDCQGGWVQHRCQVFQYILPVEKLNAW
jgi:hypothetical protein